jgi:KTSC domain
MEVVALNTKDLRTAAFAARLRRLRIAYNSGLIRDYADIPPALFSALVKSEDPDTFLRERVAGQYAEQDIRTA